MYHSFLIHSSADGHLGRFHVLAIINSAVMNIGVHVSLSILVSSVCMLSSVIAGSYGSSISSFFFFLRNLHTVTLWERERVGWFGRMALKHVYHIRNESPVQVRCRIQETWGWCTGMTQRDGMGRELGGFNLRTRVHPWWIHVDVWQNQ